MRGVRTQVYRPVFEVRTSILHLSSPEAPEEITTPTGVGAEKDTTIPGMPTPCLLTRLSPSALP